MKKSTQNSKLLPQTPSQTVGPYFAYGLSPEQYLYDFTSWADDKMVDVIYTPNVVTIVGKVFDGEGKVIPDALIEVWKEDEDENQLFGRYGTGTDKQNRFIFHTTKPKSVNGDAPYLAVVVFMRGQLIHSFTRIYFSDEEKTNKKDSLLKSIPADRRHTLVAQKVNEKVYEFNIFMQGENETVFFEG